MTEEVPTTQRRKTRIVCISDTHNQTPKLPAGDVLIHAGDLTNQGSYSELQKTVSWLEQADFEAKIIIAGNHDITLDGPFYKEHGILRRYPEKQDPDACRKLLLDAKSITYLENEAASIFLNKHGGPHTCFRVFGSPYSPTMRGWAFGYGEDEAEKIWDAIPSDVDIVVTHGPPKGHCDASRGCEVLRRKLSRVRPMLCVFGHIHEGRGVERVRWNSSHCEGNDSLVEDVESWKDPGAGNKKISQVNLTSKGGHALGNSGVLTGRRLRGDSSQPIIESCDVQPSSTSGREGVDGKAEDMGRAHWGTRTTTGGAFEHYASIDMGNANVDAVDRPRTGRRETAMINAALSGARVGRKTMGFNKPIVVDVELPGWRFEEDAE